MKLRQLIILRKQHWVIWQQKKFDSSRWAIRRGCKKRELKTHVNKVIEKSRIQILTQLSKSAKLNRRRWKLLDCWLLAEIHDSKRLIKSSSDHCLSKRIFGIHQGVDWSQTLRGKVAKKGTNLSILSSDETGIFIGNSNSLTIAYYGSREVANHDNIDSSSVQM